MNLLRKLFDERFLEHRRRSTSLAGVTAGFVATGLFAWRYYIEHQWSPDLFVVVLVLVVVKLTAMTWYAFTD